MTGCPPTTAHLGGEGLQAPELISVPEPGVGVPERGHDLAASEQQLRQARVAVLHQQRQPPVEPLAVRLVDVQHQGGHVEQDYDQPDIK